MRRLFLSGLAILSATMSYGQTGTLNSGNSIAEREYPFILQDSPARFFTCPSGMKGLSLNLGMTAKTEGFLLEDMSLNEKVEVRIGASVYY